MWVVSSSILARMEVIGTSQVSKCMLGKMARLPVPGSYSIRLLKPEKMRKSRQNYFFVINVGIKADIWIPSLVIHKDFNSLNLDKRRLNATIGPFCLTQTHVKSLVSSDTLPAGFAGGLDADFDQHVFRSSVLSTVICGHSQLVHVLFAIAQFLCVLDNAWWSKKPLH